MKKKDIFVSTIKGFITGILSWVTNMSIASMILSVSSYDHVVEGFNNIRKKDNKDLWYVAVPILIGICCGLLAGHRLISFVWNKYQLQTIVLCIGLFVGGIRVLFATQKLDLNKSNIFIPTIIITIGIVLILLFKNKSITIQNGILNAITLGLITGISFLIPGTSSFLSNINNGYHSIINSLEHINKLNNCIVIISFIIICLIAIITFSKIVKFLMTKNKNNTYIALCSCIVLSIITLIIEIKPVSINFINIFTSVLAFLWGYIFAKNVERE